MKYPFPLLCFLATWLCTAQKNIIIDPDLVVGSTKFNVIDSRPSSKIKDEYKANLIFDQFREDSTDVFIGVRGYCIWGLYLRFAKDTIIPTYYFWDDGGGKVTELPFESYKLTLSSANPKKGERLRGKFDGVLTEIKKDGKLVKHHLHGKFTHEMEDTPARIRWERQVELENLSKKIYLQTGFYSLMSIDYGMEINAHTYSNVVTGREYYLYNSQRHSNELLSMFSKSVAEPDKTDANLINVRLLLDNNALDYYKEGDIIIYESMALVVDDKLYFAGSALSRSNGSVVIPIAAKTRKEAENVAQRLNVAIQKHEKSKKAAKRNPVEGG